MLLRSPSLIILFKGLMHASFSAYVGLSLALLNVMAQQVSAESLKPLNTVIRSQPSVESNAVSADISSFSNASEPLDASGRSEATSHLDPSDGSEGSSPSEMAQAEPLAASCVAGCNPNAAFVFHPPSEAIALPSPSAQSSPTASSPASALEAATPIAASKKGRAFGLVQISNPPLPIAVPATNSDYQSPFPPPPAAVAPAAGSPPAAAPAAISPPARLALTPPVLRIQGVYIYEGGEDSARARFSGVYPLTRDVQVGGTIDLATGNFSEINEDGVSINELYLAASLRDLPNLRFVVGQLDLTSYFDRNSFAKDRASQFFNPVFQTNPALAAAGIGSRPGALLNWSVTDNLEARAAVFSSDRSISDFSLDGFAGEVGLRLGSNFIIRGTYATGRDGGAGTSFREVGRVSRGSRFGLRDGDREEAYGVNAELFIPSLSMGLFGRYGRYDNRDLDLGGDTYVFGLTFLDLFLQDDRLGIGYGRELSNDQLRRDAGNGISDAAEIFYDFQVVPHLRLGLTFQALDNFSETIAGVRIRTEFDLLPRRTP
jgi:hypothetical protein